jgi:phosphonatase-like hydrolase
MTTPTPTAIPIELVVFDLAGTTVRDDGLVEDAFLRVAERSGVLDRVDVEEARDYVRRTMGMSKLDVLAHFAGDEPGAAEKAAEDFEVAYAEIAAERGLEEVPGAADTVRRLRDAGVKVVFTTGFTPTTRDAILAGLGWSDLADDALSPADAGRGRPAPDLVLTAALRAGVSHVGAIAVVGDTVSDAGSGLSAGAGLVVGVLSGAHDRETLEAAGAHVVVDDITSVPDLVAVRAR